MAEQRILLDVDTGTDDAIAILYALRRPGLRLEGITTVFGNSAIENTTRNTLQVLELAGRPDIPVARGAEHPLQGTYTGGTVSVHGMSGLGDLELPPPLIKPIDLPAVDFIIQTVRKYPGEITLVPTGRMTNMALALRKDPEIASLARCVLMGGAATVPGNASAAAEANILGDPEAAHVLFQSGMPITMVGLDVTMSAIVTPAHLEGIVAPGGPVLKAVDSLLGFRMRAYMSRDSRITGCAVHDALAVEVVADPSIVGTEHLFVAVECRGAFTRGMTLADRRNNPNSPAPNVHVCLQVDAERFIGRMREHLGSYGERG